MKKLTNFFNCAANGLPKTGGGNSQLSLRSEGARHKALIESCSWSQCTTTLAEQPANRPLINRLSPANHPLLSVVWKYVACLLIAFFVGVGNVWGADVVQTFSGTDTGDAYLWAATKTITKSTITIEFNNVGGGLDSNRQRCKTSGTATKAKGVQLSNSAQSSINEKFIGISSTTAIKSVNLDISQNGTTSSRTATAIYFNDATSKTPLGYEAFNLPSYDNACDTKTDIALTVPSNCKYIRLYKQVKYDATNKVLNGTAGANIPSSNATNFNVFGIEVIAEGSSGSSITLDKNGGTSNGSGTLTADATSFTPTAPTYADHTVDGYYTTSACATMIATAAGALQPSISVSETTWTNSSSQWKRGGDATFYAHWKVNTPTISCSNNTVTISVPTGSTVYYTDDNSTPASSSTAYSAPFAITATKTIKAIAIQSGCTSSDVASRECAYAQAVTATWPMYSGSSLSLAGSASNASISTNNAVKAGDNFNDITAVGDASFTDYTGKMAYVPTKGTIGSEGSVTSDHYVKYSITVASGYTFTPTGFSAKVARFATDYAHAQVVLKQGSDVVKSSTASKPNRSGKSVAVSVYSESFDDADTYEAGTVIDLYIYFGGGMASGKNYGIADVSITGEYAAVVAPTDYTVTINPNGGNYASTPTGWTYSEGVYTKTVTGGTSFSAPAGLTKSTDELSWKDGLDNDVTFPVTISSDITFVAQWTPYVESSNANLSALSVAGCTLNETFDASTTAYTIDLPFGSSMPAVSDVTATKADTKAEAPVVTISNNVITIACEAEDGTKKNYTITVTIAATKDIELVWATDKQRCDATTPSAVVKSNNAAVSTYINQITFTNVEGDGDDGAESGSLNVGKKAGNMFTLTAKAGYAFKAMSFYGKIEADDAKLEFSLNGGAWQDLASTASGDACYADVFSAAEVHELRMRSAGSKGFWIRNMQLTMIHACTPKTIAWTTEPAAEYEVGVLGAVIAAEANNGTVSYASTDGDVIAVNATTGALTVSALGTVTLSASVPAGDGTTYCDAAANVQKASINTYYLVTFDKQNGESATLVKYYKNDDAIALPSAPSWSGYTFQGWFDAETGGNAVTSAVTPSASRTIYAQWEAQCDGPTITAQPASANYLTGRTPVALACTATAGAAGELTYTWYSCDDALKTNPVALAGAPTPSTAAVGTFYYYCVVTEAGCAVERTSDVATITVADKDPVCIIKATPTTDTEATADGAYKGSVAFKSSGKKLNSKYDYVAVQLMEGKSFLATDKVVLNQTANLSGENDITKFYIFTEVPADGKTYVTVNNASPKKGDNWFTMPAEMAGESLFYIGRVDSKCNPTVGYLAVYRVMAPELVSLSVNSIAATKSGSTFTVTLPAATNLASLSLTEVIAWNAPAASNSKQVTTNEGAWAWGDNTYVLTDKDGDATTYTITLNQAAAIKEVQISGTLTVMEEASTTLSAAVYDTNDELAGIQDVTWSVKSGDEDYAEVSTSGVVTGKAIGTAHIIATSVADPTISAQVEVAVTAFSGCKKAYWFGYADDAATNNVANNSTVFDGAPSSASSNSSKTIKLIEDEWEVSVSKKTGSIGAFGTFTVPAGYNATLYLVTNTGGSRTFQLKQSDVVKYTQNASSGDPVITKFEDVAAGTYTVLSTSNCSGFYMMAAELCRVPMTGVALDITSKSMLTIDPAFQLTPTFTPANATDKRISWTTTDGDVATVVDGLVTPVGAGTATITVTTADGGYTATCEVTVSEINCTSFEGTIYEMTAKEQATRKDIAVSAGVENEVALTVADVVYTRGAAASLGVKGSSAKTPRITAKSGETLSAVDYNSGDVYVKIPLGCNLRSTDVITLTANDDTKEFKLGNTAASEGTISTSSLSYTVQSGDALEGRNVLYVWRGSNTGFVSVNVTRVPLVTIESVALADMTIRAGKTNTPQLTVTPGNGTILSAAWEITAATGVTGSTIDAATGAVTAGTLDDPEQDGTITVKVTLNEDDDLSATCTITVVGNIAQTDVDGSIIWDWRYTGATSSNQLSNKTDPKKNENFVLANVVTANANFATDKLVVEGEHLTRDYDKATPYFQGQLVSFRFAAATEGVVRITYSHTTSELTEEKPAREIYINDVATGEIADNATFKASALIPVNASEVTITARNINSTASDDKQYLRIAKIEFYALDQTRSDSWIAPRELGTVCYPNGHIVVGADMYKMAGVNENGKFAFDQVEVTEPGVPYLFEATGYDPIKFYKTTAAAAEEAGTSNGMVGTFVQKTLSPATDVNAYYFQGTHFYAVADRTKDLTVPANRCYVDLTEPHAAAAPRAGVRRITFGVNGTNGATGFENIEAPEGRVQKVLIDGKIYILRGEKVFDMTGKLVK